MDINKVLQKLITEEISKSEISSMISNKIDSSISYKEFEKKVKEIATSVISDLFKILWQRDSLWKNTVKR